MVGLINAVLLVAQLLLWAPTSLAAELAGISAADIDPLASRIGGTSDTFRNRIRSRLADWNRVLGLGKNKQLAPPEELRLVNDFMNGTPFYCDPVMWCMEDFWTKPVEFLANDGGDCEDFAIAKFYTLKALGVPEDRLRIVYAVYQSGGFTGAHMVLAYYPTPEAEPFILDNINQNVLPASARPDLIPVFSFNTEGAWNAQEQRGRGSQPGGQYPAWSEQWRRVQADAVVRSVTPEQRKSAACQALIRQSVWCR
jgi:predicted transglutaminase-like cysteine proteinase